MGQKRKILVEMYGRLMRSVGPRHWWPGESAFEVIVGAILTQNTSWTNVEKAIGNLKRRGILSPSGIKGIGRDELARVIRPSGFYRLKADRLKRFVQFLYEEFDGDMNMMKSQDLVSFRERLLKVDGIGPETADSIILYALEKPVFVIDAYTKRILNRHYLCTEDADYHELQELFMDNLDPDVPLYNEYHALIVETGKDYCRTKPRCDECPLNGWNW